MTDLVHSGLSESSVLGKVHGPYTRPDGIKFVIVVLHNENGSIKSKKTLTYKKYIEEYDLGLHRYEQYVRPKPFRNRERKYEEKEINCDFCKKLFLSKKGGKSCSKKCAQKVARRIKRNRRIDYHNQFVIKIKGLNNEDYFIIYDRFHSENKSVFIEAAKCKTLIIEDENDVVRYRLFYEPSDAVRVKLVPGYKKLFWITENAILISRRTFKVLSQSKIKTGYLTHATRIGGREGKEICLRIHRLVAFAFILNPDNKPEVNHIDGNKVNNHISNLEWVTPAENSQHAWRTRLSKPIHGTDKVNSKLDEEMVRYIRTLKGIKSERSVAKEMNIGRSTITRIFNNRGYKNVL